MGYVTDFTLHIVDPGDHSFEDFDTAIIKLNRCFEPEENTSNFIWHNPVDTWWGHDWDMLTLSKQFPNSIFELTGFGESSTDIWRYFYKNGQMCGGDAAITFPEYLPSNLKPVEHFESGD